jgi:hypothetical protein
MVKNCLNCRESEAVKDANYLLCRWHGASSNSASSAEVALDHASIDCDCEGWKRKLKHDKM